MDEQTQQDLEDIFATVPPDLRDQLIQLLSSVETNTIRVRTRSNNNRHLEDKLNRIRYFTVVHTSRRKPVIFAGACDHPNHESVPAIRFGENNSFLADVPKQFMFPYWQRLATNDTNVMLNEKTVVLLLRLFRSEIDLYVTENNLHL